MFQPLRPFDNPPPKQNNDFVMECRKDKNGQMICWRFDSSGNPIYMKPNTDGKGYHDVPPEEQKHEDDRRLESEKVYFSEGLNAKLVQFSPEILGLGIAAVIGVAMYFYLKH